MVKAIRFVLCLLQIFRCAGMRRGQLCVVALGAVDLVPCDDVYHERECQELRDKGFCTHPQTKSLMRENCAATCGVCQQANSLDCVDLNDQCEDWRSIGLCSNTQLTSYEGVIAKECRKTCALCEEYEICKDRFSAAQCKRLVEMGKCETMQYMMSRQCAPSCDFCHHEEEVAPETSVGWSEWGVWSLCDVICGEGVRYRSRTCRGGPCFGVVTQSGGCVVDNCPKSVCHREEESYCPFYKEMGYCTRPASVRFMTLYCSISCELCTVVEGLGNSVVTSRYKLCVERALNEVVYTSLHTIPRFTVTEEFKEIIIKEARLPVEAQDSLRKLSRQGLALTLQDRLFNDVVAGINDRCGVETPGTRGYIESKLLESKVIEISRLDCSAWCEGVSVGEVYRTMNGTCNNCGNPLWGSSTTTIIRLLDAEYEDTDKSLPRGWAQHLPDAQPVPEHLLVPSARHVTNVLLDDHEDIDSRLTLMHFQWGQFLDHDLILTPTNPDSVSAGGSVNCAEECSNVHPCFPIQLSESDPITNMTNGRRTCLPFTRSAGIKFNVEGSYENSNQINEVTSYIDGSNVYGSSGFLGLLLEGENGTLRVGESCKDTDEGPMLPNCPNSTATHFCACGLEACPEKYIAGDARVNEQPMLTLVHTLWVREHNRIAGQLRAINQCWDSEKTFQETRKIVIAMMQHITYRLYLPVLLGPAGFKHYIGFDSEYDSQVHAGIQNGFGSAAFRFGHSQIPSTIPLVDRNWTTVREEELHGTFFRPNMLCESGFDNILRGLLITPVNNVDKHFTSAVLNQLFAPHVHAMGLDLTSINVQRGRDHGIPPYVRYREYCQQRYKVKAKFQDHSVTLARINLVYGDINKLDLFIGGIVEEPVNDGLLGPTFSCIIGEQFQNLRDGDRLFYTHEGVFTEDQLREIFKTSLAGLSCDNSVSVVDRVPRRAFIKQDPSEFVKCSSLAGINFEKWRQCSDNDGT